MQIAMDLGTETMSEKKPAGKTLNNKETEAPIESLLKELAEDKYKYDLRFWPDNKITLEAIKKIAADQVAVMFHRIDYVIRKITELGGSSEQIHQVMLENYRARIKELSQHWWKELNDFYRKTLQQETSNSNLEELIIWGKHASESYAAYKMFCKYIDEEPQPEPGFIKQARQAYMKLKGGTDEHC